ncbi:hypothetical protein EW145_g3056 [Phellinidium pouzarii]|uniref:RNase P subunit p30 n=1 Tax=Phellinidium pouzarii TaxID=167371 RepID=A0A4S4LA32_9AGAM|nr:hypothetical protein EW145_g3056 [Phellinidium pouzarii]
MFFDLSIPVPTPATQFQPQSSKKNKGKQPVVQSQVAQQNVAFSPVQISKLESRIDLLVRLGYTVIAFNQTIKSKVDSKGHVNVLDPLLKQLKPRPGVIFLKRLTIVLDEDSEKGNGLTASNSSLLALYDLLALHPTNQTALSSACLTHTQPSALTTHIISLPLTAPRLPFRLKHTLIRTAIKNGAVFEINYAGALHGEDERRNWWASARELARVSKGKGLIVSGDAEANTDLRAPRDVGNLLTLLGLAQNLTHDASTVTPKSLVLRAQTRRTYRAILSEPTLIMPAGERSTLASEPIVAVKLGVLASTSDISGSPIPDRPDARVNGSSLQIRPDLETLSPLAHLTSTSAASVHTGTPKSTAGYGAKRLFDSLDGDEATVRMMQTTDTESTIKKKRAKTGQNI